MKLDFKNDNLRDYIFSAEFGLEKECLRVNEEGYISKTQHPFTDNDNIQKDFCESQTEFISNVFNSAEEVCDNLRELHRFAYDKLFNLPSGKEFLWPFSNPPYVKEENDIPVAVFNGDMKNKSLYREYLAEKYGKMKMLYSGIHFNFSFSEKLLKKGYESFQDITFMQYKNKIYLELSKKVVEYAWLIVYLTAASPVMDGSFFSNEKIGIDVHSGYSSARCSEIGYWNDFIPILSYRDLESYVSSIKSYVDSGKLRSASELYYPVRLKPRGENSLENLLKNGVNHIELRMLDDNPLSPIGIFEDDIKFIHILIIYLISQEDFEFSESRQINAIQNEKAAAKYDDSTSVYFGGSTQSIREQALDVLNNMDIYFSDCDYARKIIAHQKKKITEPNCRYAELVADRFGSDYVHEGLKLARKYADEFLNRE